MGTDQEVLEAAVRWLDQGQPVYLVTVGATWGSAPRPLGSLLAVSGQGAQTGSVSGGCVEEDLVERVRSGEFATGGPHRVTYGVTRDQAERFGLPCGGRLELVLERLEVADQCRLLLQAMVERRSLVRRLCLNTGEVSLHPGGLEEGFGYDGDTLLKDFGPRWQLLVIGASHVARYLTPIAQSLGYRVILCEPRAEHADAWDLPATELERGMPDDAVQARANDPRSAVVALTHDPRLDDMALMSALTGQAFYVGALGSAGNNAKRRRRLMELGLGEAQVARLRGPVGLPIGGRTPPEIAVSIAADLTAVRHGRVLQLAEAE